MPRRLPHRQISTAESGFECLVFKEEANRLTKDAFEGVIRGGRTIPGDLLNFYVLQIGGDPSADVLELPSVIGRGERLVDRLTLVWLDHGMHLVRDLIAKHHNQLRLLDLYFTRKVLVRTPVVELREIGHP